MTTAVKNKKAVTVNLVCNYDAKSNASLRDLIVLVEGSLCR